MRGGGKRVLLYTAKLRTIAVMILMMTSRYVAMVLLRVRLKKAERKKDSGTCTAPQSKNTTSSTANSLRRKK
jgi:hypothetical protein